MTTILLLPLLVAGSVKKTVANEPCTSFPTIHARKPVKCIYIALSSNRQQVRKQIIEMGTG
jgi:hypothetical protein